MPPERYAVGIDLGGTKLRGGILSQDGRLVARLEVATEAWKGSAGVLANLKDLITRLLDSADRSRVAGIGIAAAGQIHPKTQAVVHAPNLGWRDVPLRDEIESGFALPTCVENDVRAAAWGEYRWGVGRGVESLIAVFVGTGIGSGAVVDGLLLRGFTNVAGELGHTQVVADGLLCGCGRRGCVEAYASGGGLVRRLESALTAGVATSLAAATGGDPSRLTAVLVARAASAGDTLARQMWADAEQYLGMALAGYVTLLNPELLILGGGVVSTVPSLFDVLVERVRACTTVLAREVRVERAGLADSAGIIGAADRVWAQG